MFCCVDALAVAVHALATPITGDNCVIAAYVRLHIAYLADLPFSFFDSVKVSLPAGVSTVRRHCNETVRQVGVQHRRVLLLPRLNPLILDVEQRLFSTARRSCFLLPACLLTFSLSPSLS